MYEFEMKFEITETEHKKINEELKNYFLDSSTYTDMYLDNSSNNLRISERELRIRKKSSEGNIHTYITYKGSPFDENTKSKPEYEVEIEDENTMKQILLGLGFKEFISFRKECTNFSVPFMETILFVTTVYIEELKRYFIEIEIKTDTTDETESLSRNIIKFAGNLDIDEDRLTTEYYIDAIDNQRKMTP